MTKREYKAYLLRLWRESKNSEWRVLLVNPNSGDKMSFATLPEFVRFFEQAIGEIDSLKITAVSPNKKTGD
jgi:hypothetical protein